jgi:ABC-type nickel/cobalt efflux system permease component RcnA
MGAHRDLAGLWPARPGWPLALCAALALGPARPAHAHPVPRGSHDRNVVVRLAADGVTVHYHLEVDSWTLIFEDLPRVEDRVDVGRLSQPHELYGAFTRTAAADLAAGLRATLDGRPLTFVCVRQEYADRDSVQCDFQFRVAWELSAGRAHAFAFREGNYDKRPGLVKLSLEAGPSARLVEKSEPDEALQARPEKELTAEDRERLRNATATVETNPEGATTEAGVSAPESGSGGEEDAGLVGLFLHSRQGPWLLLLLSAGLGAAHALTPGHGKTLVAAYLVGERGTTAHAVVLGLVTTLTHTGVVLVLALVLRLCFPRGMDAAMRRDVHRALELVGGLLIAGLGLWLLLRRLANQADHVHIGGAHHHHHGPGGHHHHHHPTADRVGWWGLITLGISGGIVPCWDAVALLLAALALNLLWWALPMLLAFSAGLAGVLVLIGILVVHTRALAGSRFANSRLFRALPLCSAAAVTGLGLWLCYSSLHAG